MNSREYLGYKLFVFPFEKIDKDEEIILYGFGKVGKQYYWQIRSGNYCRIKCIADRNYESIKLNGVDIVSPDSLRGGGYKVVVSVQSSRNEIIKTLINRGWTKDNIICSTESILLPICWSNAYTVSTEICTTKEDYIKEKGSDVFDYFSQIKSALTVYALSYEDSETGFVRVGKHSDGGYLMVENFSDNANKIAYSFGIADDVSWDSDMADKGYHIYMFDHTINELPYERDEFHFSKKGISDTGFLHEDLYTLDSLFSANGHEQMSGMILKMDVEGAEYGFINSTDSHLLNQFDQIVMEYHDLLSDNGRTGRLKAMQKLLKTHFPVHIHANNLGAVLFVDDNVFADCVEVTYVNRNRFNACKEVDKSELYLSGLDEPCWFERDEVFL